MIHSGYEDNWKRIKLIHEMARFYYLRTQNTESRRKIVSPNSIKDVFPFCVIDHDTIDTERCLVEMLIAWSVITIDSIANYYLSIKIDKKDDIINYIKSPNIAFKKNDRGSELFAKIRILRNEKDNTEIKSIADRLANIRNSIVHDKPFNLIQDDNGDVKIEHYSGYGVNDKIYRYSDLTDIFKDCDFIIESLNDVVPSIEIIPSYIKFVQLLN